MSKEKRESWRRAAPSPHTVPSIHYGFSKDSHSACMQAHTPDSAAWSGRREGEKGLDWPFKSHLGSESLGYREGKGADVRRRMGSKMGIDANGGVKAKYSDTQRAELQICLPYAHPPTHTHQTKAVNLPSQLGEGGARKNEMLSSPFSCFFLNLCHPPPQFLCPLPIYDPFPLKFPIFYFPSGIEVVISACRMSPSPNTGWQRVGGIVVRSQ